MNIVRRLPLIPTLVVLIAVAVMVRLGLWQLDRLQQKEAMLARYAAARTNPTPVPWPQGGAAAAQAALFHRSTVDCRPAGGDAPMAGHDAAGTVGWAHSFRCTLAGGGSADVVIGWSRDLAPRHWAGGVVTGTVAPGAGSAIRLIADPPLAGLAASAAPDPRDIPNNHLSYAVQWFAFAGIALVIYGLALRKRLGG